MSDQKAKEQAAKEKAAKIALEQGMTLVTRDLSVWGLLPDGTERVISHSKEHEERWQDALRTLEGEAEKPSDVSLDEIRIFTDGGSRGNPGPSASGYVILDKKNEVLEEGGEYLGITTNNQAEYKALRLALESARKFKPRKLDICLDSELVVKQLNGQYKMKNQDLWPIHAAIKDLLTQFPSFTIRHVRREFNQLADAKVNEILDSHEA